MARSWDELSPDHKIVFLLESFVQKQDQRTPIACRVCDEIFFDNKSLMNHFQSHFQPDGTSSQHTHSFSVPVNARNHVANENIGSSKPTTLSFRDSLVSTPSKNPVQLRGPTSTHRHQPYPSTLIFRSPKSRVPAKPVSVGDMALGKRPQTAMENKVEGPFTSVTRPFIMELEKQIEDMTAGVIDVDADELDLTLKL